MIVHDGGIIADIGFKAAVIEILEYYPKRREVKDVEPVPEPPKPPVVVQEQVPEPPAEVNEPSAEPEMKQPKKETKDTRAEMLVFLQSKKMKLATINALSDKELAKLCAVHGGKF